MALLGVILMLIGAGAGVVTYLATHQFYPRHCNLLCELGGLKARNRSNHSG